MTKKAEPQHAKRRSAQDARCRQDTPTVTQAGQEKRQAYKGRPANSKTGATCKACHESKTWWWTWREYICDLCHAEEDGQHDGKIVAAAKKLKAHWVKREVMLTKRGKKKKELEEPEFF